MNYIAKIMVIWAAMSGTSALAETPYDGIYYPEGAAGWSCNPEELGGDVGALGIIDGVFYGVENTCDLVNPVEVRDMQATLYDAHCSGEGFTDTHRLMLMPSDNGVYVIKDGYVSEWARCK